MPGFTAPGAFAERIALPRADANLAALPDGRDPALGCQVTTVWHALTDRAALAPGEWLAVQGAGGVGLAAVMLGTAPGARVVAVEPVAEKRALAARLGAAVVDPGAAAPGDAVHEITGGGAHVSIDALGAAATVEDRSLRCARAGGMCRSACRPGRARAGRCRWTVSMRAGSPCSARGACRPRGSPSCSAA